MSTHALGLDQAHVVVLRVIEVVLVEDVVLRYHSAGSAIRSGDIEWSSYSHPVPTIQTGPADSERIPRPLKMEIWVDPPESRSWSASHTQVP